MGLIYVVFYIGNASPRQYPDNTLYSPLLSNKLFSEGIVLGCRD